jgi:hypothetical protein
MNVGMLWFDGDRSRDVPARIRRAADYYQSKYGRRPTVCYVHPAMAAGAPLEQTAGLKVQSSPSVLKDHLWLGVEEVAA